VLFLYFELMLMATCLAACGFGLTLWVVSFGPYTIAKEKSAQGGLNGMNSSAACPITGVFGVNKAGGNDIVGMEYAGGSVYIDTMRYYYANAATWIYFGIAASAAAATLVSRGAGHGQWRRAIVGALACIPISYGLIQIFTALYTAERITFYMGDVQATVLCVPATVMTVAAFKGKKRVVPEGNEVQLSAVAEDQGAVISNFESNKSRGSGAVTNLAMTAVVCVYTTAYVFFLVPLFRSMNGHTKFYFRVFAHPVIVVTGEAILRTDASHISSTPPQIKALNLILFDMFFQLTGRLMMVSGEEEFANILVMVVALQELAMRVSYIPKQRLVRRLVGLPPMSAEERMRFLEVLSIDSVSSMQSEIAAICIATCLKVLLFEHRLLFDFGFHPTKAPVMEREVKLMLLALVFEGASDLIAMAVQTRQGLRLKPLWAGQRRWEMAAWLLLSQCAIFGLVVFTFFAKPTFFQCKSDDLCSCDFYTSSRIGSVWCGC